MRKIIVFVLLVAGAVCAAHAGGKKEPAQEPPVDPAAAEALLRQIQEDPDLQAYLRRENLSVDDEKTLRIYVTLPSFHRLVSLYRQQAELNKTKTASAPASTKPAPAAQSAQAPAPASTAATPTPAKPAQPPAAAPTPPPQPQSPYYSGDGGKGMSLAILVPQGVKLAEDQDYLPAMVQGVLVTDFSKYSAMNVLDRQNLEKVLKEAESGVYQNEAAFVQLGQVANVGYAMTGTITKTGSGYALQIQVADTSKGTTKASYTGNCTIAEFDNFIGIRRASADILTQLGVALKDQAKTELAGASSAQQVSAQTALAQGITAQKGGTVVEALSYYIQSSNADPGLAEAASRLNILTANVTSGNIGEDVRNDIQWRNQWIARLRECEEYFANYIKDPPPYYLVYSTNIQRGKVDYEKETVPLEVGVSSLPKISWFYTANQVVDTVKKGLDATGRAATWGLNTWPETSVSDQNPFSSRLTGKNIERGSRSVKVMGYWARVEILNDQGATLGNQDVWLISGWEPLYEYKTYDSSSRKDLEAIIAMLPMGGEVGVIFPAVDANKITNSLSIQISRIDGSQADTAAQRRRISIFTEKEMSAANWEVKGTISTPRIFLKATYEHTTIRGVPVVRTAYLYSGRIHAAGITFPDGFPRLGNNTFFGGTEPIQSWFFPDSVTSLEERPFINRDYVLESMLPDTIIIGAGVNIRLMSKEEVNNVQSNLFDKYPGGKNRKFFDFYISNGKKAGTYTCTTMYGSNGYPSSYEWSFRPR